MEGDPEDAQEAHQEEAYLVDLPLPLEEEEHQAGGLVAVQGEHHVVADQAEGDLEGVWLAPQMGAAG